MNYAYPVRCTLSGNAPVRKTGLSFEAKDRRNYIASHKVSIRVDEKKNVIAEVTEK